VTEVTVDLQAQEGSLGLSLATPLVRSACATEDPKTSGSNLHKACLDKWKSKCDLYPPFQIYDINFYEGDGLQENLQRYYTCCMTHSSPYANMIVTTSCFGAWRKTKKCNGTAKVIPAVRNGYKEDSGKVTRVFFFDDNINLHLGGEADSEGICNLRDLTTGEFVEHSVGKNGFRSDRIFRQTVVQHSSEYNNVLIQVNILDVMVNPDFFTTIISRYAQPGENLLCFFDVNGVLVWDDTSANQTVAEVLLKTMFRFIELRPRGCAEFVFQDRPAIKLEKPENGKSLAARVFKGDNDGYHKFWELDVCRSFLEEVSAHAEIAWETARETPPISAADFFTDFQTSLEEIQNLQGQEAMDGIPESWPRVYNFLNDHGHTVVLNSFGADTHRAVKRVVPDIKQVLQLTVNYDMWGERDWTSWGKQFTSA